MSKKTKSQANKEFLDKIKSINIGTSAKQKAENCPDCGNPIQMIPFIAVGTVSLSVGPEPKPEHKPETGETSFAA